MQGALGPPVLLYRLLSVLDGQAGWKGPLVKEREGQKRGAGTLSPRLQPGKHLRWVRGLGRSEARCSRLLQQKAGFPPATKQRALHVN